MLEKTATGLKGKEGFGSSEMRKAVKLRVHSSGAPGSCPHAQFHHFPTTSPWWQALVHSAGFPLVSSLLPHPCASPCWALSSAVPGSWSTTRIPSLPCSLWSGWCRSKGGKEGEAGSEQRWHLLPQQKLYRSKANSAASLVAVGAAGGHSPWNSAGRGCRLGLALCRWCSHSPMKAEPRTAQPVRDPSRMGSSTAGPAPAHTERGNPAVRNVLCTNK